MLKIIIAFCLAGALWRLGGAGVWLGKAPRRYILPIIITLYAIARKRKWWLVGLLPTLIAAISLGYGESKPYWAKFLVACAWIVPKYLFLGFSWFPLAVPFIWILLFKLSNTEPFSHIFKWQFCEIIIGGLIGIAYVL